MNSLKTITALCALACLACLSACTWIDPGPALDEARLYEAVPDSVRQQLRQLRTSRQKAGHLLARCEQWHEQQPEAAMALANWAEQLSKAGNLAEEQAVALYWKAFLLNQRDPQSLDLHKALAYAKVSAGLLEKANAPLWQARALNLRALIHYNLEEEAIGAQYNQEAQQVLRRAGLSGKDALRAWGDIYRTAGNIELFLSRNIDTVLANFGRSYQYYIQVPDTSRLARLMNNYAIVHHFQNDWILADSFFRQAIGLCERLGQKDKTAMAYLDYATFHADHFKETHKQQWFAHSNRWLAAAEALRPANVAEVYFQYGANFQNRAIYEGAAGAPFFDSASHYYQKVLTLGVEEQNTKYIEKVAREIARICPDIGSPACTGLLLRAADAYQAIADSTRTSLRASTEIIEQFKDEQARERQRRLALGSALFIIGLAALFFVVHQRSRIRLLRLQLATRLEALRSQMNPHFISNSLNAIDSLVNQGRNEEASEYIIDFSRLCRLILSNSKKELVSLDKELETLGYYLSLEKLRMGKKLSYAFDVDEELNQAEVQIPPMLLQPFIENAIIHGIQNKQAPGRVLISVKRASRNMLECTVEDDGVGRKRARELQAESVMERASLGIAITRERVEAAKKAQGARIEIADLEDEAGRACGTQVAIHLPLITKPENT